LPENRNNNAEERTTLRLPRTEQELGTKGLAKQTQQAHNLPRSKPSMAPGCLFHTRPVSVAGVASGNPASRSSCSVPRRATTSAADQACGWSGINTPTHTATAAAAAAAAQAAGRLSGPRSLPPQQYHCQWWWAGGNSALADYMPGLLASLLTNHAGGAAQRLR